MDKRTLLFVFALGLTLFGVNIFFEQQRTEKTRQWVEQQDAKKTEKLIKLKKEVDSRTAPISSLPVATLYADSNLQQEAAIAVKGGNAYILLAWEKALPAQLFIKDSQTQKTLTLFLSEPTETEGFPAIYRSSAEDKLLIGSLQELGKYDLQLLQIENGLQTKTFLAEYINGQLSIPLEAISTIEKKSNTEDNIASLHVQNALVLIKSGETFLPVAIYQGETKQLEMLDTVPQLAASIVKQKKQYNATTQKTEEKFYVIETPYQQLVFSNFGGALAEINLPFQSVENPKSVVKEIEFDREMVEKHPYNAYFPDHSYYTASENSSTDYVEHPKGSLGGYYPLLRRNLIEKEKRNNVQVQPRYYGLNIVSEYPETAELVYEVKSFDKETIVFESIQGHRRISKTFSVASESQAPYCIDLSIKIEGDSRGLWITSGIPEVEWISGSSVPVLKYRITRNQKSEVETIDLPKNSVTVTSTYPDWICNSNGFLGLILDPLNETDPGYRAIQVSGTAVPSRLVEIDQEHQRFNAKDLPGYMMMLPLKNSGGAMHFRVFAGPFSTNILKQVDSVYSNASIGYNPDYIACQSFHGWFAFISEPFAKFLFILMNFFHTLTGSWAFSIVLLTIALRIMLWPLNAWSTKSMVRMQRIAPQVTAIQEKNKKDPKKAQLEIMNLYRESGVNPVSGCFPLLIQMPFLVGMFDLLKSTFELRGASFIPGWIDNLTSPDVLFSWNFPIFFIGTQFHLLPILLGLVMFLQQRYMSTTPKDPALMTDQQRQQRFMGNIMSVVFTVMFYNFPSGLNIYWLSSMLLGILQQYWTTKRLKAATPPVQVLEKAKK
jgi:YidC/Oxa1 family membrane protein insertase